MFGLVFPPAVSSAATTYNSQATATAGNIIAGTPVPIPGNTVTANTANPNPTGGQGEQVINTGLQQIPVIGPAIVAGIQAATPTGANLYSEAASANPNGNSSACAGFLTGDCTNGPPPPITIKLAISDLTAGLAGTPLAPVGNLLGSLPGLAPAGVPTQIVLTLHGPQAACTAGPNGSGKNFTATQTLGGGTLDLQDNTGKSVLPNGPVGLQSGSILGQLPGAGSVPGLGALPLGLILNPGSVSGVGQGPQTTATAGELGLTGPTGKILDVAGAKVTCGPNDPVAATPATPPTTAPAIEAAAPSPGPAPETPLGGGIQSDEGYWAPPHHSSNTALWLGFAGGLLLLGAAGGITIWRRRLNRS